MEVSRERARDIRMLIFRRRRRSPPRSYSKSSVRGGSKARLILPPRFREVWFMMVAPGYISTAKEFFWGGEGVRGLPGMFLSGRGEINVDDMYTDLDPATIVRGERVVVIIVRRRGTSAQCEGDEDEGSPRPTASAHGLQPRD